MAQVHSRLGAVMKLHHQGFSSGDYYRCSECGAMRCQKEWEFCANCGAKIIRFDDSSRGKPVTILVESYPAAPKSRKIAVKVQTTCHEIPLFGYSEKPKKGA
jgi:hypothetical protein